MANEINQYPLSTTSIGDNDYYDTDAWSGTAYESRKILGSDLKASMRNYMFKDRGYFNSLTTQTSGALNSPQPIYLEVTDPLSSGISIHNDGDGAPTLIVVNKDGVYNLQFSAQIERGSGGSNRQVSIWLQKNGAEVADSNTHITLVANSGKMVASWNFLSNMNGGDTLQIMWSVNDISIQLMYVVEDPTVPHPASPSVIVSIIEL